MYNDFLYKNVFEIKKSVSKKGFERGLNPFVFYPIHFIKKVCMNLEHIILQRI
jgi:hypothetical protein